MLTTTTPPDPRARTRDENQAAVPFEVGLFLEHVHGARTPADYARLLGDAPEAPASWDRLIERTIAQARSEIEHQLWVLRQCERLVAELARLR